MPHRPARDICVSALISIAAGWGCCCATPAIAAAAAPGCADHNPVPCERSSSPYTWQSVKIVDGGVMPGIYTHPTEPGLMYIRANVGGAYRWNAATSLWIPLTDWLDGTNADWSLMGIESIALDPTDPDRLYLAAGMYIESWITINGAILISRNQGRTFDRVNLPFKLGGNDDYGQQGGERLAVNPFQPNQLYLGTHENGLWLSSDYGATWSQMASFPITATPDLVGVVFVRFDPRHQGTVYVGAYTGGIYRSTDSGATWQQVPGQPTTLPDGETLRPMRCALGPDGLLYVTYANSPALSSIGNGAVYKLDTNEGTWTDITPPDTQTNLWYGYCAVGVDAQRKGTVMVGTWNRWWPEDDFFRSTDGGATWRSLQQYSVRDTSLSPFLNYQVTFGVWNASFEVDPFDSNHALYDAGNSVWATNDLTQMDSGQPTHWYVGANGIEETVIRLVVSPPSGAHLFSAVGDEGGFRHDDFDVSPVPFLNPLMIEVASLDFAELNPLVMARVGLLDYDGDIAGAFSTDGGVTWTELSGVPPGAGLGPTADGYVAMVAVSANGSTYVWAPPDSVPAYIRNGPWVSRVVSDRVNPNKFYGYDANTGTVYASTNGGVSFVARATGLPQDIGSPGWTAEGQPKAVFGREGDIWLPTSSGLYHSTNSGASFTRIGSIESAPLVGFGMAAPGASYPAIYAVGTVSGVYGIFRSDGMGASWVRINDDAHQFGMLGTISGDSRIYGRVYVGTQGRGIVYGDLSHRVAAP
ncbi:MAG: carbohydrate-binding protein [Bryobacteraceae bacterium]